MYLQVSIICKVKLIIELSVLYPQTLYPEVKVPPALPSPPLQEKKDQSPNAYLFPV